LSAADPVCALPTNENSLPVIGDFDNYSRTESPKAGN